MLIHKVMMKSIRPKHDCNGSFFAIFYGCYVYVLICNNPLSHIATTVFGIVSRLSMHRNFNHVYFDFNRTIAFT